jgi:hypothetical protein
MSELSETATVSSGPDTLRAATLAGALISPALVAAMAGLAPRLELARCGRHRAASLVVLPGTAMCALGQCMDRIAGGTYHGGKASGDRANATARRSKPFEHGKG